LLMFNSSHKTVSFHHPSHIPLSKPNKKPMQGDYDSVDDLETCIAEEAIISQKLPSSLIPVNIGLDKEESTDLQGQSAEMKNRSFSYDGKSQKKYSHHEMLREAINDYKAATKQKEYPSSSRSKLSSITTSPSRQKYYPNPFESSRGPNRENKPQYYEESEAGSYSHRGASNVSAYTELANRMYIEKVLNESQTRRKSFGGSSSKENLILSKNAIDSIEARRHLPTKEWQEETMNRLIRQGTGIDENANALISSYLTREMAECTFAPKTASGKKPTRNLQKFLEDQRQHQEKVEFKRQILRERNLQEKSREREETTFQPEICRKSAKIVERKSQEATPAYQRLYNKSKPDENTFSNSKTRSSFDARKSISTTSQLKTQRAPTPHRFTPEIHKRSKSIKRDVQVDKILYGDALRRRQKQMIISQDKEKRNPPTPLSQSSKKALTTRFIREFDIIVMDFIDSDLESKLNSTQVVDFLKRLSFLKEYESTNHPHSIQEKVLLYDMWYTLRADKYQGIHRRNLLVFLLAVLNMSFTITKILKNPQSNNSTVCEFESARQNFSPTLPDGQSPRERQILGSFDIDGNYSVTEQDVQDIHKIYNAWFVNRLHSSDNIGQLATKKSFKDFSYQPEINKSSSNMAQNYREKLLAGTAELIQQNKVPMPKDGKMTHIDLLIASKKVVSEKISRYSDAFNQEQQKDCTFKPQTKRYSSNFSTEGNQEPRSSSRRQGSMTPEPMGKERVFELYSKAKPYILKRDRHAHEVEFERQLQECTFHPNVQRSGTKENDAPVFAKGIEKNILRMRNARNAKEKIQKNSERGSKLEENPGYLVFTLDNKIRNSSKDRKSTQDRRSKSPLDSARPSTQTARNLNRSNSLPRGVKLMTSKNEQIHLREIQNVVDSHIPSTYRGSSRNQKEEEEEEDKRFSFDDIDVATKKDDNPFNTHPKDSPDANNQIEVGNNHENDDRVPLLFVDVNLGLGQTERITVLEGDTSEALAQKFALEYGLNFHMQLKLKELLDFQIDGLLSRIDEEPNSGFTETEKNHYSHQYSHHGYPDDHFREHNSPMK